MILGEIEVKQLYKLHLRCLIGFWIWIWFWIQFLIEWSSLMAWWCHLRNWNFASNSGCNKFSTWIIFKNGEQKKKWNIKLWCIKFEMYFFSKSIDTKIRQRENGWWRELLQFRPLSLYCHQYRGIIVLREKHSNKSNGLFPTR